MVRILLVDDEPFIVQGLKAMIELENPKYRIVGEASDGKEALEFLKREKVDLIIADVQMPVMSGLELLETIRKEKISDAYFMVLSGYSDFQYAQQALRYDCIDYVLKPVKQEDLRRVLRQVERLEQEKMEQEEQKQFLEQAMMSRSLAAVLTGEMSSEELEYVEKRLPVSGGLRYVELEMKEEAGRDGAEYRKAFRRACQKHMGEKWKECCVKDIAPDSGRHCTALLLSGEMLREKGQTEKEFLQEFLEKMRQEGFETTAYAGVRVNSLRELEESRRTAAMVKSLRVFGERHEILWYEEEQEKKHGENMILCKEILDELIRAAEENDAGEIARKTEELYRRMGSAGMNRQMADMNLNYLLFELAHLAMQQNEMVTQEEIFAKIREGACGLQKLRDDQGYLERFVREYAEYLVKLRKKSSRGVLAEVEKEISEHYAENLTLKEMSRKFFVNSAYLGQMFKKKHGISFKEYLNNYRIEQAAELLLRTDKRIYEIAEAVGYHDLDYFINRFISAKGCTPSRFRKKAREEE